MICHKKKTAEGGKQRVGSKTPIIDHGKLEEQSCEEKGPISTNI